MKKYAVIAVCLILGGTAAQSQTQSTSQSAPSRGTSQIQPNTSPTQPGYSGQASGIGVQVSEQASDGRSIARTNSFRNQSGGALQNQNGSLLTDPSASPSGVSVAGSTNQPRVGVSGSVNTGGLAGSVNEGGTINEAAGAQLPSTQIGASAQIGSTNQASTNAFRSTNSLGSTNQFSTKNFGTNSLGFTNQGSVISESSGAATPGVGSQTAQDRSFTQRLRASVMSGDTNGVYSPQNMSNINISSHDGVVTLTGTVKNEGQKRSLEARFKQMEGVKSINNQLTVSSDTGTSNDRSSQNQGTLNQNSTTP